MIQAVLISIKLCNSLCLGKDTAASQLSCAVLRGLDNIYGLELFWVLVWFWMQFKVLVLNVKDFASLFTKFFTLFCLTLHVSYYVYFQIWCIFLWLFGRPWSYVCVRKWNILWCLGLFPREGCPSPWRQTLIPPAQNGQLVAVVLGVPLSCALLRNVWETPRWPGPKLCQELWGEFNSPSDFVPVIPFAGTAWFANRNVIGITDCQWLG